MKKALNKLLFILLLTSSSALFSQIDTVFWFAAPWVTTGHAGNKPVKLRLTSFSNPTIVRVRQPSAIFDTTFTIPANSLISESLSHLINQIENVPANTILNRGIKITSNFPITAIYEVETVVNNPETYSLKGQNGMGNEFVCPFQTKGNNGPYLPAPKSQIDIIATQNSTTVWITPRCNVVGHLAGITYSIILNAGQSYNVENVSGTPSVAGQNLSGTIVFANKPVSVTVSDDSVGGVGGCFDLMGDQIVPVEVVGKEYIINKGGLNASQFEGIYAVATENFTQITINDGVISTVILNKGDTYFYKTAQPLTYVVGDKPIYVIHVSGFGCELGEAIIPPLNCAGSDQVSFTRTNSQTFILNVLCKTASIGDFLLNGSNALIPASQFTVVPGTSGIWSGFQRSYTTVEVPVGITSLLTNSNTIDPLFSMGVINGGAGSGCLYHYMSSFLRRVYTTVGLDQNICTATTTISLTGNVQGGSTSGIWTAIGGTGTFTSTTSLNTTYSLSVGDLGLPFIKFVLSSTGNCVPITDTLIVYIFKSPVVTAGASVTLCKNNISPVSLSGTLQYAAGANWTTTGSGSFGSTGSLNTTYLPSPADLAANSVTISLTSTGSLNGCPNTFDSLIIKFTNPPIIGISPDVAVCANNPTVAISGTVSVGSTTGIWSGTGSGLFSPSTTSLTSIYQLSPADIAAGIVVIKLTSTANGNCLSVFDSLIITVTPKPIVNAGINDTICSSNVFYSITGSVTAGASTGIWTTTGNGTFGSTTALSTIYTLGSADTLTGQVKLILTSTGGNCLPVSDTMLLIIAKAPLVNAGPDNVFCDNQLIPLNGTVLGLTTTGVWSTFGTGVFTPDDSLLTTYYQPSPLDLVNGFVKILLTSTFNKGCSAVKDTMKIVFKGAPNANFISNNECAKKMSTFTDNSTTSAGTITGWWWNMGDASTAISINVNHSYSTPGTYTVTHVAYSSNGCNDTIKKPVEIYFLPNALFFQNAPCVGNTTQFVDSSKTLSGSIISWNWNFGDTHTSGLQNPQHAFSTATVYSVSLIVTSSFGCKDTIVKVVTVLPGPHADFNINPNPVEALETAYFTDLSTGPTSLTNWNWYFGDSTSTNIQSPQHSYNNQGNFIVTLAVKDINGCIDTVRKEITVVLLPDVPSAFSPNGDGQNDLFLVRGGPFKSINVRVYNNWGQLIFETNDQLEGWNGTYNGTEQPISVFVWVVEVEMFTGKKIKKTGDVTLLR
jgi:gliding motility-associated-like protein